MIVTIENMDEFPAIIIGEIDLVILPQAGDRIFFNDELPGWYVRHVAHSLTMGKRGPLAQSIALHVSATSHDEAYAYVLEWETAADRPAVFAEEFYFHCDAVLARGDILQLAQVSFDASGKPMDKTQLFQFEVVAIARFGLLPDLDKNENEFIYNQDSQLGAIVRRFDGDIHVASRILAQRGMHN